MRPKRSLLAAAVALAVMLALSLGGTATSVYGQEAPDTEATPTATSNQPLSAFVLFLVPALDPNSNQAQNVEACRLDQLLQDSGIDPTVMGSSQDSASTQLSSEACALLDGLLGGIKDAGSRVTASEQATATPTSSAEEVTATATPAGEETTATPEATQTDGQAGDVSQATALDPDLAKRCDTQSARENDEVCKYLFQNCGGKTEVNIPQQGPPCPIDETQTSDVSSTPEATSTPTVEPETTSNETQTRTRRSNNSEAADNNGGRVGAETASSSPAINLNVIIIPMIPGDSSGANSTSSDTQLTSTDGTDVAGECTLAYLIANAGVSVPMVQTNGGEGLQGVAEVPNTPLPADVCDALTKLFQSASTQSAPSPTATPSGGSPTATPTADTQNKEGNNR